MKNIKSIEELQELSLNDFQDYFNDVEEAFTKKRNNEWLYSLRRTTFKKEELVCSECASKNIIKHGFKSGSQRFRCKDCNKTFTEFKGTVFDGLRKKTAFREFIEKFKEGKSVSDIAKETAICGNTAFKYRHMVMNLMMKQQPKKFDGIVETDDVYFRLNRKNLRRSNPNWISWIKGQRGVGSNTVSVQVTLDRTGNLHSKKIKRGAISSVDLNYLNNILTKDNLVCSDSSRAIRKFMKDNGYGQERINSSAGEHVRNGYIHVNTLNSLVKGFRLWIRTNFNNVSTKYIGKYFTYYNLVVKGDFNENWLFA